MLARIAHRRLQIQTPGRQDGPCCEVGYPEVQRQLNWFNEGERFNDLGGGSA